MLKKEELTIEKTINNLKKDRVILILIVLGFVFGIFFYPLLPNRVPLLWNLSGKVIIFGNNFFGAFGIPLLNLGFYLLFLLLPNIDVSRKNYSLFQSTYQYFKYLIIIFLLGMEVTTYLTTTGVEFNMPFFIRIFLSFLILLLGNVMMRFKK